MQRDHSLVQVKELSKGVESIVEVDWKNPEYAVKPFTINIFFINIKIILKSYEIFVCFVC